MFLYVKHYLRSIDDWSENYYCLVMTKPAQPASMPPKVPSQVLLGARKELVITHNGREYRLRVTQSGKLILTA